MAEPTTATVVTGGSSGIGAAVARAGLERGPVATVQRGPGPAGTTHVRADLLDVDRARTAVHDALDVVAPPDRPVDRVVVLHAAATVEPIGFAAEVDPGDYARAFDLDVRAAVVVGAAALAALGSRPGRRQLVQVTSGAASSVYAGWSAYGPAKAAVEHWVATVAEEQRLRGGLEVLAVAPGVVATSMQEVIRATDARDFPRVDKFRDLHEAGDLRDPDDVAAQLWGLLDGPARSGEAVDLRDR
ncbi:SDR family NAD(P)-dependent oxidoreductase [Salsipaludibacter albus]|uniref:SDR family NAD(P)-dependent oxidoreductase n=1 Tax=Salsipaludibacter albus TaxID=2849650 RepID=UPI001EE3BCF3|nr:SDR family NAD(P)-dependent oxidoreductase [Salsipaludibacter albus]MBY5163917.1 SDR family NAD(P)-dependent oxidoreductase [Salsipaludibacter albus]